jgi:hypothetical protein
MLNWRYTLQLFVLSMVVPFILWSGAAYAQDACVNNGLTLPECNTVSTPPLTGAIEDWALYCPPQEPYHWYGFWGKAVHGGPSYDYSVQEHAAGELDNFDKGDFTIAHWFPPSDSIVVTQGCSPVNPNGGCTGNGSCQPVPTGPGTCSISNRVSVCVGGGESKTCWDEYSDTCVAGNTVNNWWCTNAEIFRTCCFGC